MAKERASEETFFRKMAENKSSESNTERLYSERRKHKRFKMHDYELHCHKETLLSKIGFKKENIAHTLHDISAGGAKLVVNERLALDSPIRMKIDLPKFSDTIETTGRVAWIRNIAPEEKGEPAFQIGVTFHNPESKECRKIDRMKSWFLSPQAQAKQRKKLKDLLF